MTKPPSETDKKQHLEKNAASGAAVKQDEPKTVAQSSPNNDLTQDEWEKSKKPWNSTPGGRLAIRTFSRGIMGAAFFTAGGVVTRKWMHDPTVKGGRYAEGYFEGKYDAAKPLFEQDNPLKFIAKLIDTVVGKPIEATVRVVTGSEDMAARSVRFRPSKYKDAMFSKYIKELKLYEAAVAAGKTGAELPKIPNYYRGRSLGNEAVTVTFDFFCASIGDAMGRDIVGMFDPSVAKPWRDKDGNFSVPETVRNLAKTTWRYVSYNGGEDWAVAIPYSYFMKGQRAVLNKISPGWYHDFDRGLHGSSFKTVPRYGTNEARPYEIVGNYNIEGAIDFQNRFVVYNMGTLAYRELYSYVGRKMHGKHAVLYGSPDKPPPPTLLGKAADVTKWLVRSVIKGGIYMTPAVPFFWITRVPQTNHRGIFINPETGETLSYQSPKKTADGYVHYKNVYANDLTSHSGVSSRPYDFETQVYWSDYKPDPQARFDRQYKFEEGKWLESKFNPVINEYPFGPYDRRRLGLGENVINKIGQANYALTRYSDGAVDKIEAWLKRNPKLDSGFRKITGLRQNEPLKRFSHSFINASASYTPYMYAKAEFANLWDDGKMDMATERMIDGATKFSWREFKAGAYEVWRSILHKPFVDPKRNDEAMRRVELDDSPPASVAFGEEEENWRRHRKHAHWRDRVIQAHPDDRPEVGANSPKSHAEREEMRKALEDMHPPTNAIN